MADDWSFRTGSGVVVLAGGELRVRRTPRTYVAGWYARKVCESSLTRTAWNVFAVALTVSTVWQFFGPLLGGLPREFDTLAATSLVGLAGLVVIYRVFRPMLSPPTIPLRTVERVIVDRDDRSLTVKHDGGATELDLRTDDDVATATRRLRLHGVTVDEQSDERAARPHSEQRGSDDGSNPELTTPVADPDREKAAGSTLDR